MNLKEDIKKILQERKQSILRHTKHFDASTSYHSKHQKEAQRIQTILELLDD